MAQEVRFDNGRTGKIRSFWVGFGLTVITLGIYHLFWYYYVNDELKNLGIDKDDVALAQSSPGMSLVAVFPIVNSLIIPPLVSVYKYSQRIRRAEGLGRIPDEQQIKPILAFLLYFPGSLLLLPLIVHFWYVTKHQDMALLANCN